MRPTLAIVAPCFNEEDAILPFLGELDRVVAGLNEVVLVVVVDDGSLDNTRSKVLDFIPVAPNMVVELIALPYTMGHQDAIYQGLLYAGDSGADRFIVMDADGEDDPHALVELASIRDASVVFVARGRRSESLGFRLGYRLYRTLFRLVTGHSINHGNYSMIDRRVLRAVLDRPFIHYAAFLSRQRAATRVIIRDRRKRLHGASKMGYKDLGMHAFKSLIEYSDEVLTFFLKAFMVLGIVFLISVLTIVGIKLFTGLAIPGWASNLSATMFNSLLVCLGFFTIGLMLSSVMRRSERSAHPRYTRIQRPA